MCLADVDACTVGIGSSLADGRKAVNLRVPLLNALRHEFQHWKQMQSGACLRHTPECGFDPNQVEAVLAP